MATASPQPVPQSRAAAWVYQHLVSRRVLPLAILVLWGCLLTIITTIHPATKHSDSFREAVPFLETLSGGVDYYQFWIVGRARERFQPKNIYSTDDRQQMQALGREILIAGPQPSQRLAGCVEFRKNGIETFSTPFLYAALNSVAIGRQFDADFDRYLNLCLTALILSILLLGWMLGYTLAESLLFTAAILMWCEPLASDLMNGNVNQLQLAGVTLYLLLRRGLPGLLRDLASGFVLGILVAFKPTLGVIPMLLGLAWIVDRRWGTLLRQGCGAIVGVAAAFVIGCLFLHSWTAWWDWKNVLPQLEAVSDISVAIGNHSLARVMLERTGTDIAMVLLVGVLLLAGVAILFTRPAPGRSGTWFERDFLVTGLACAVSVIALRLTWPHYFILLLPLLIYLLRPSAGDSPILLGVGFLGLLAVLGKPLVILLDRDRFAHGCLSIAGAWMVFFLGLAALGQGKERTAP